MLINLSNHPSSLWPENQLLAAAVYGDIIDLPFPAVDPSGDENDIEKLADEYIGKIVELSKGAEVTVHLMGEMTFTFSLLCRLRDRGIVGIASTTNRMVVESIPGHKETTFRFERFRKYRY